MPIAMEVLCTYSWLTWVSKRARQSLELHLSGVDSIRQVSYVLHSLQLICQLSYVFGIVSVVQEALDNCTILRSCEFVVSCYHT